MHLYPFYSSTPFGVGNTHTFLGISPVGNLCPGSCQSSPRLRLQNVVCMQHYVEISKENTFYNLKVFISQNIDDWSILNLPAIDNTLVCGSKRDKRYDSTGLLSDK